MRTWRFIGVSWQDRETVGQQAVADVHSQLQITPEWSLINSEGFTWWPHQFAQSVWTDEGVFRNSRSIYRLHTEIDLVRGKGQNAKLNVALEHEMDQCNLSALVYDKASDTYRLHSSVFAEEDNIHWISKLFSAAVTLQVVEAKAIAAHLAVSNRAAAAISGHPTAGLREEPDKLLGTALGYFTTGGAQDCRWIDVDEWKKVDWAMERQALDYEMTPGRQLTARFFWAADESQTIDLAISTDEPHEVLGNGLHFTLMIPLRVSAQHIAQMALELNENERANWHTSHMLGSWCSHYDSLAFRLFIPNALYQVGILEEIAVTMATRAIWVTEFFLEKKEQAQMARDATVR